jgi:signal transduction histidine kinase
LQNEKLSTLGLIAGSIAHEVKNPLSSIKTIASVLAEDLGDEHKEDFELIVGEIDRLSGTVTQLLQFARPANEASSNGSTLNSIQGTLRVLGHLAKQRNVSMDVDLPETLPAISANHDMLREVIFNLISNSIDATSGGGHVGVLCRGEEGRVKIEVRDDGPGLSPEVQDRLFEPFVTTKDGGTGLGLYIVGRRVREMGGEIHCETQKGEGTVFTVILPVE